MAVRLFIITIITLLITACTANQTLTKNEISDVLVRADSFMKAEELDSAAKLINHYSRIAPEDTTILWSAALINHNLESVQGRRVAVFILRRLVAAYPDNNKFRQQLAKVLMDQTYDREAIQHLELIINNDPAYEEAYLQIADFHLRRYFRKDYHDHSVKAESLLTSMIEAIPQTVTGNLKLASLLAVNGRFAEAKKYTQNIYQKNSISVEINLLLGYINYYQKDYQESWDHFQQAFEKLDSLTTADYQSLEYLMTLDQKKFYQDLNSNQQDSIAEVYWQLLDIDPTTEINERQLEHYARIWEANLYFSDDRSERIGAHTAPGETLIRLGKPDSRIRKNAPGMGGWLQAPVWYWRYESTALPCTLAFIDHTLSGNYHFPFPGDATGSIRMNQSAYLTNQNYIFQPEESSLLRKAEALDLKADIFYFRGTEKGTEAYLFLEIPAEELYYQQTPNGKSAPVEIRQALQSNDSLLVWRSNLNKEYAFVESNYNNGKIRDQWRFPLAAGEYQIHLAIEQREFNRLGLLSSTIKSPNFITDSLVMSDIIVSRLPDISQLKKRTSKRDSFLSGFYPQRQLKSNESLQIYYELYNLPLDVYGRARYEVTYAFRMLKANESGLKRFLTKTFGSKNEEVSFSYHEGVRKKDFERTIAFDLSDLRAGHYRLIVEIREQLFNRTTSQTVDFELVE